MFDDCVLDVPAAKRLQNPHRNRNVVEAACSECREEALMAPSCGELSVPPICDPVRRLSTLA